MSNNKLPAEVQEMQYPIKWEVKSHSYQIGDTGDYDGYWEITNGKDSLITKEDYEDIEKDLRAVVDLLNNTYANFTVDRGNEAAMDAEIKWLRQEMEDLKKAQTGAIWVKASERLPGIKTPVKWRQGEREMKVKAVWYMVLDTDSEYLSKCEWLDESGTAANALQEIKEKYNNLQIKLFATQKLVDEDKTQLVLKWIKAAGELDELKNKVTELTGKEWDLTEEIESAGTLILENESLKAKGEKLALALRRCCNSMIVHPDYQPNSEFRDRIASANDALNEWKEKKEVKP